jgi:Na+(H+)/acetate symporter ActP
MGSSRRAQRAATTFTKDWYVGVFRQRASSAELMRAARVATVGFAVLMARS